MHAKLELLRAAFFFHVLFKLPLLAHKLAEDVFFHVSGQEHIAVRLGICGHEITDRAVKVDRSAALLSVLDLSEPYAELVDEVERGLMAREVAGYFLL